MTYTVTWSPRTDGECTYNEPDCNFHKRCEWNFTVTVDMTACDPVPCEDICLVETDDDANCNKSTHTHSVPVAEKKATYGTVVKLCCDSQGSLVLYCGDCEDGEKVLWKPYGFECTQCTVEVLPPG